MPVFRLDFLGPRGPILLPLVGRWARPPARKNVISSFSSSFSFVSSFCPVTPGHPCHPGDPPVTPVVDVVVVVFVFVVAVVVVVLKMIIRMEQQLANDHLDGPASCK